MYSKLFLKYIVIQKHLMLLKQNTTVIGFMQYPIIFYYTDPAWLSLIIFDDIGQKVR